MGDEDTGQPLLQLVERVAIMALELGAPLVIGEVDAHPSALTVRPERSRGAYVMRPCQRPSTTPGTNAVGLLQRHGAGVVLPGRAGGLDYAAVELAELLGRHFARGVPHQILGPLVHRE